MRIGVAIVVVMGLAAPAAADNDVTRYAEQTLAADALSFGLVMGGQSGDQMAVRDSGLGIHLVGAPLVHLAHGNYRSAGTSLALRITLPLAGAWLGSKLNMNRPCFEPNEAGATSESCHDDRRLRGGAVLGLVVGMLAVSVIDATTLAKKSSKRSSRELRPALTFKQGGVRINVVAKF